jgi:hypothetical protein
VLVFLCITLGGLARLLCSWVRLPDRDAAESEG